MNSRYQKDVLRIRQHIGEIVHLSKEDFTKIAKPILKVDIDLNLKFVILDFQSLLANNAKNNQTLSSLCEFLEDVETLCKSLTKQLTLWDFIPLAHTVYQKMLKIKGGKELFQLIGYTEVDDIGLQRMDIPDLQLKDLLVDIIIARCELTEYLLSYHPLPHYISQATKEFPEFGHSCNICGLRQPIVTCNFCSSKNLCEKCDAVWHSHPKRTSHDRIKRNPVSQSDNISSSYPVENHKASSSIVEEKNEQSYVSEQDINEASEMSIQQLKFNLIELSHQITVAEKPELKQILRRKWNAFLNIFNQKTEDAIIELNEHIKNVERHIQILVMNHPDFYRHESYSQLNDDKIHTQKKLREMRKLRECCSNQTNPEDFRLKYMQMHDGHSDENKSQQTFLESINNSDDTNFYVKKSPQVHNLSKPKLFQNPAEFNFLTEDVVPPPDLEYQITLPRVYTEMNVSTASLLSSKSDLLQTSSDVSERKRSKTLSDIFQPLGENIVPPLFDSQNWNGFQEESYNVNPLTRDIPFGYNLAKKKAVCMKNNAVEMLNQEKFQAIESVPMSKESSSIEFISEGVLLNQAAALMSPGHRLSKSLETTRASPIHNWNPYSPGREVKKMAETMFQLNEKKVIIEMQTEAGQIVQQLRLAEVNGYEADVMLIALEKHKDDGMEPLDWIKNKWPDYISTVIAMAVNKNIVGLLEDDVECALKRYKGNVDRALETAIKWHKKRIEQIKLFGDFSEEEIVRALQKHKGDIDCILEELFTPRLAEFQQRVWQPPEEDSNDSSLPQQLVDLLLNKNEDPERRARAAFSEISFKGWRRAEYVIKILDNHLENVDHCEVLDVVDVVQNSITFENAVEQLTITCNLCLTQYPQGKIMTLSFCDCKFCKECFLQNFKIRIREEPVRKWTCPTCSLPELNDEETITNYFAFLNLQLKQVIDEDTFNLYETKLRDWHLHKDPNFRWCPSCENGFLYQSDVLKMDCPHCNRATCFKCMKPWQDQHQRLSCEKFNEWLIANDPNNQAFGLELILKKNGIVCPECKTPYFLAKGGCIHFTCKHCQHEFCAGCQLTFYQKEKCHKFNDCPTKGIHAHHPRNCLYYLRDEDVKTLQKLLKSKNVHYDVQAQTTQEDPHHCFIMVQKEIHGNTLRDEKCGNEAPNGYAGLCVIHYKEYLVNLINQNKLDPISIFTTDSLKQILSRNDRNIPEKGRSMSDKEYRRSLEELVKQTEQLAFGD